MTTTPTRPPGLGEWRLSADRTEVALDVPVVTVRVRSRAFEPPAVAGFAETHGDGVTIAPRAVFTADLDFDPPPPRAPTALLGIAARYARREFRGSLREDGLLGVRDAGERTLRHDRGEARAFRYEADYPLDGRTLTGQPGRLRLPVAVWAAIWPTAGSFAMGGGVYPLETVPRVAEAADRTLTGPVTLAVDPETHERETIETLRGLARRAAGE